MNFTATFRTSVFTCICFFCSEHDTKEWKNNNIIFENSRHVSILKSDVAEHTFHNTLALSVTKIVTVFDLIARHDNNCIEQMTKRTLRILFTYQDYLNRIIIISRRKFARKRSRSRSKSVAMTVNVRDFTPISVPALRIYFVGTRPGSSSVYGENTSGQTRVVMTRWRPRHLPRVSKSTKSLWSLCCCQTRVLRPLCSEFLFHCFTSFSKDERLDKQKSTLIDWHKIYAGVTAMTCSVHE